MKRRIVGEKKSYKLNRATCAFGSQDDFEVIPKIWGNDISLNKWTPELLKIKKDIEKIGVFTYGFTDFMELKTANKTMNYSCCCFAVYVLARRFVNKWQVPFHPFR